MPFGFFEAGRLGAPLGGGPRFAGGLPLLFGIGLFPGGAGRLPLGAGLLPFGGGGAPPFFGGGGGVVVDGQQPDFLKKNYKELMDAVDKKQGK